MRASNLIISAYDIQLIIYNKAIALLRMLPFETRIRLISHHYMIDNIWV